MKSAFEVVKSAPGALSAAEVILRDIGAHDIRTLILPDEGKPWWGECAYVISKLPDSVVADNAAELMAWFRDLNWPGVFIIYQTLLRLPRETLGPALETAYQNAEREQDEEWAGNLNELFGDWFPKGSELRDEKRSGRDIKVIVINGPMGVGKTATGRAIADKVAGTAFIDGDWCMDIHPFVGNRETKAMAVDNILHMIGNYQKCSECGMVVLAWLMDDPWVHISILDALYAMGAKVKDVTLVCDEASLLERWKNDRECEWRTEQLLGVSLSSLPYFASMENVIDTSGLTVDRVADMILRD